MRVSGANWRVSLSSVSGDIRGRRPTAVNIDLTGDRWDGAGLDVETHSGIR
jgi:hypothetical protein